MSNPSSTPVRIPSRKYISKKVDGMNLLFAFEWNSCEKRRSARQKGMKKKKERERERMGCMKKALNNKFFFSSIKFNKIRCNTLIIFCRGKYVHIYYITSMDYKYKVSIFGRTLSIYSVITTFCDFWIEKNARSSEYLISKF